MTEQSIFLTALDIADPTERAAYLNQTCGGNAALRQQVEALLAAHERCEDFLEEPAPQQLASRTAKEKLASVDTNAEHPSNRQAIDLSFLQPSAKPGALGRLAHYEVVEVIGQGGCGIVMKAFDDKLQRTVAIKVLAPKLATTSPARQRFPREARAAAAIRHENVVGIFAVEDRPIPYLVMEYIDGETLQQRLDRTGPLDVQTVLRIGQQVASGLAAAAAQGLIHRDIKPANILLQGASLPSPGGHASSASRHRPGNILLQGASLPSPRGRGVGGEGTLRVKIADFGLARAVDDASITQSGLITGTPLYMSPEQARGEPLDPRSDLFSLGSVLYHMVSGQPPFQATTILAVLKRVAEDQPPPLRTINAEVPDWLVAIISRLHAKNPDERFATAKEVAELLARCLTELGQPGWEESLGKLVSLYPALTCASTPVAPVVGGAESGAKAVAAPSRPARVPRNHPWSIAAAVLVALVAGLGTTEATGVTNVRGAVIRLFSPDGTLVVEVDDPGVSVSIDGADMVITGAGAKEIRLKPGQYKLLASKDGKVMRQELVTVTTNGRQVVRVSQEAGPAVAKLPPALAVVDRRPKFGSGGDWRIEDGELVQSAHAFSRLLFGDPEWTDYDFAVEGQSIGKDQDQGIILLFRARDLANYHQLDLGGWSGTVTEATFQKHGQWGRSPGCFLRVPHEHGRWYTVKITVRGPSLECLVDGKSVFLFSDESFLKGMIGLGTHNAPVRWRNLKVTAPDGRVLWQGFPEVGSATKPAGSIDPDRRAAEWVLSIGGKVRINHDPQDLLQSAALPTETFHLTYVNLDNRAQLTDESLLQLNECKHLAALGLANTNVGDVGLRHLRASTGLTHLYVPGTKITDEGLALFQDCRTLLALGIGNTAITDHALDTITRFKHLQLVDVTRTKMTEAGVKQLAAALPGCRIIWDGGTIEPGQQ